MALTLRNIKGSALTWTEMDENFSYLDNKIIMNVPNNITVLNNFKETNGVVTYNNIPINMGSIGTIAEFEAALLS